MEDGFFGDETEQHVEQIKKGNTAMLVIVRVRPLTPRERAISRNEIVQVMDQRCIALSTPVKEEGQVRARNRQTQFAFDFAYSEAKTKEIYDESVSNLLEGVLDGFNSTVLAYGATGCGKTYTMVGEPGREGVIALTMIDLLSRANEEKKFKNVIIKLAYIQIYNESIKDLLVSEDKTFELREDPKEGFQIPGVTEIAINSMLELSTVLKVGAVNRSKEETVLNEASSRSHAILIVRTEAKDKAQGVKEEASLGRLMLVDLAGSERAGGQKGSNSRQIEGGKINRSLLALGNCIQVLAESSSSNRPLFIPYRQSKLTRLLKQSLGGNCRTAMIANISPFNGSWQQTHNTLVYASRAKNIKNAVTRNVLQSENHVNNYISLIGNLKRENEDLKKQLKVGKHSSLPHLKSGAVTTQSAEVDRLQKLANAHFAEERKLLEVINELTIKLDKHAFRMYRLQLERKPNDKKKDSGVREKKLRKVIEDLDQQKSSMAQKLQELVLQRSRVVEEMKYSSLGANGQLMVHYRQKKIELELFEIKLKEARLEAEKQEKEELIESIGNELKVRDKIIEDQKILIQKNNIINRITYSRISHNPVIPHLFQKMSTKSAASIEEQASSHDKKRSASPKPKQAISPRLNPVKTRGSQAKLETNPVDVSWEKYKEEEEVRARRDRRSMMAKPRPPKIKRNGSGRKYQQLDLVYMQR